MGEEVEVAEEVDTKIFYVSKLYACSRFCYANYSKSSGSTFIENDGGRLDKISARGEGTASLSLVGSCHSLGSILMTVFVTY